MGMSVLRKWAGRGKEEKQGSKGGCFKKRAIPPRAPYNSRELFSPVMLAEICLFMCLTITPSVAKGGRRTESLLNTGAQSVPALRKGPELLRWAGGWRASPAHSWVSTGLAGDTATAGGDHAAPRTAEAALLGR